MNLDCLRAAAGRRSFVFALLLLVAFGLSHTASAQNAVNAVTITPPAGVEDPDGSGNTATDNDPIVAPQLTLTKTHAGNFVVGSNGVYTLSLSNTSSGPAAAPTAGIITVEDTLPAGLSYVSATGTGWTCAAAGQVVTCNTNAVIASGASAPAITLTVAVDAAAAPSVTNTARVSGGGDPTCPASGATQARCNPSDPTTVTTAAAINFCAVDSLYNITQAGGIGSFYQYNVGGASDTHIPALDFTVTGNLNGMMVDPVRNRLLFISYSGGNVQLWAYDAGNGGWYAAATAEAGPDMPRAGMTSAGVGYLIAGGSATPQVWRVNPEAGFGYTITPIGQMSYDIAPTDLGSGDIAFDAAGNGWMTAGQDLYKINFTGSSPVAVRQQRPLLNGSPSPILWAGVAFSADGDLYVATNASPSRYFRLDMATGTLTQVATTTANQARDLASCAFPAEPQPAQLRVAKTLGLVNGAPYVAGAAVKPNDLLTYHIEIEHIGGDLAATLFPGDIVDSPLPANTTYVAAGNDFTCAGSSCSNTNTVNVAAGATETLDFVTRVDDPLPANLASISNAVSVKGVDCAAAGNDCTETTAIGPTVTVTKASNPASGTAVAAGDTIEYTLTVNVANAATTGDVTLIDTLSAGQTPGAMPAGCSVAGQVVTCVLNDGAAVGNHTFVYSATVNADATGSISNVVVPSGPDNPTCAAGACETTHTIVATPVVTVTKSSNPASGTAVAPGDTIEYTLTVNVANAATTGDVTLIDTLSAGQTPGAMPAGCSVAGQVVTCVLNDGAAVGNHTFVYSATVNADATGSIGNAVVPSGPDNPICAAGACQTTHTIVSPAVTVSKASNPASGSTVNPGDTIQYTLTVNVANSATTGDVTLIDTLSAGQTLGALPAGCTAAGQVVTCVLAGGALPGGSPYTFVYNATVDANATGSISNAVVPSGPDNPTCAAGGCATSHTLVATGVTVSKSSDPASGSVVAPGDTIQYTLTVNVANSATTAPVVLTDTLSAGQTLGALPAGCTAAGQVATCTLAAGSLPGTHTFVYPVTVDANATGSIGNNVEPSGPDNPTCTPGGCTTTHTIIEPRVTVAKSSNPASGATVNAGDVITYTVTVTVANSATLTPVVLTDTLSGDHGLTGTPTLPAGGTCATAGNGGLQCTLAAGASPGNYAFVYQTVVAATASGAVGNNVTATGGGPNDPDCTSCSTQHPIATPVVEASKTSAPGNGSMVRIGDTIQYTLTVTVANAAVTQPVVLTDTPGAGLTIGTLPAGCISNGGDIVCSLPTGTVPGSYSFVYPATVNANANGNVANAIVARGGTVANVQPRCLACNTAHPVADAAQLRIVKQATPRDVKIGDLVRYTLTIENVGTANVTDFALIDTPPAGFSYVAGSLAVADADGVGSLAGTYPIRVERLDVPVGQQARVQYLLRVGAGVRPGTHVNRAHAEDGGNIVSNEATAEVQLVADPLLDESLLIGTVFDDRDGDEWQDRAGLEEVRVQGGFAPSSYVAGSTTLDRGQGPVAQADASAPLLHGLAIGAIAGRQSDADPVDAHTIVIGQTLNALSFRDDFVLTSKQGVTVRMDAAGNTRTERSGAAAKGLTAADPTVERRVSQIDGGYRVEYVIGNAGVDEHGIPGVRIASVEGLLIETDQFGRYHLEGVAGGPWERGRNFILKADPATLPPGSVFTDENPLVRRLTPGVPVRFDFPVKLPSGLVAGGKQQVEMELAQVMFDAGSAQLRSEFAPVIDKIVEQMLEHGGGQVVISADGQSQTLAFDRAQTVRAALLDKLTPEQAKEVDVVLRADVGDADSTLLSLGESAVLGTFLFDTDKAAIKPEYSALIAKLAAHIQSLNGGVIAVVGHADRRGSDTYNAALGLRRAKAVFDAIAASLSPEARAKLRVDINENPAAPVGKRGR